MSKQDGGYQDSCSYPVRRFPILCCVYTTSDEKEGQMVNAACLGLVCHFLKQMAHPGVSLILLLIKGPYGSFMLGGYGGMPPQKILEM